MRAITLHDKYDEEIVGTVLLKNNISFNEVCEAWDDYQMNNNTNRESQADIYEFVRLNNELVCNLELEFYQP